MTVSVRTGPLPLKPVVFGLLIAAAAVIAVGTPASAVVPIPDPLPNPGSQVTFGCDPGGVASVLLTNINGQNDADFIVFITQNGFGQQAAHLTPNNSTLYTFPMLEGGAYVAHVLEASGYSNHVPIGPVDCYSATGALTATCVDEQLVLDVSAAPSKASEDLWWELDGTVQKTQQSGFTDSAIVAQGSAFSATIESEHDGMIEELSGVADCAVPVTIGSTIPTTAPTGVTTIPSGVTEISTPIPAGISPLNAAVPGAEPVGDLPATGGRATLLALIAAALLTAGMVILAATRRPIEE